MKAIPKLNLLYYTFSLVCVVETYRKYFLNSIIFDVNYGTEGVVHVIL
jgi:hypothetical protein